jgi:predicted P-loop ATPase
VDDTRKKSAVWDLNGHLCPLTHPKLKHEKVCLKCYENNKNKAIGMGGKHGENPTSNKLVHHLRQMHVKDGVYAAYRKAVNALSNGKLATEKQSQTSMTSFAADNNAIKRDYKKLCAKWIIATHQPLYACDSKEFKDMVQSISKVDLPFCDRKVMLQVITDKFLEVKDNMVKHIKQHAYSLTMDYWTSKSKETYGALTVHFIDNLKFVSLTICCERFPAERKLMTSTPASCETLRSMALPLPTGSWSGLTPR